jgi:hypothetical protein
MRGSLTIFWIRGIPVRVPSCRATDGAIRRLGRVAVVDGRRLVGYLSTKDVMHVLAVSTAGASRGAGPMTAEAIATTRT